ncbi:hypothetical protein SAMD00019534_100590 [Acytostelium subglobosum LB1]|uniref:hypothetical protein n=1 Tax=Acytostelium subglobosum LB1 TaxID=1410327 RepID=UPI0006447E2F|nr:hypothetical protein SAMD00019534_100590 [Acytostelium subglobosum LB1]GAM26884.1 hypothetical protein SAMD00019534_100590 [Acytostelium subglobosum LB1]|eukprot:XP_012750152.1 hypothetical protein SAMD00019534_100590 [Acytostelium subglobosum LB1]
MRTIKKEFIIGVKKPVVEYHPGTLVHPVVTNSDALIPANTEHIYITESPGKY